MKCAQLEACWQLRLRRGSTKSRASVLFFFQAEDGIRDLTVTGVQTCALPIFLHANPSTTSVYQNAEACPTHRKTHWCGSCPMGQGLNEAPMPCRSSHWSAARSEERRVGKECRSRWSPYH